nr:RNA-directed DNA polymerase, eukaryota [Tanacetum cinerariifolium]
MESFHLSFQRVVEAEMFHGISLGKGLVNLSHLFYADDAVFVGKWCDNNITTLVNVLDCFHKVSGLRINMCKSKIMGVNVEGESIARAAGKLGCMVLNAPFAYLATWVNWKKALLPKNRGGLGVSSLYAMNRGLMCKWIWRFYNHGESLWARVINAIHGMDGKIGGRELEQYQRVVDSMSKITLNSKLDRWVWDLEDSGMFSVASVRMKIDEKMLPSTEHKTRWNNYVPIKVNIHTWRIMTNSLPTRFNISRRGMCIDSILCASCDTGVETTVHIFFSCDTARDMANLIFRWWNVPGADLVSYEDWMEWVWDVRLPKKNKKMLEANGPYQNEKI